MTKMKKKGEPFYPVSYKEMKKNHTLDDYLIEEKEDDGSEDKRDSKEKKI